MRNRIDPAVLVELESVDAVLTGSGHDPEIAAIAAMAREQAPTMSPAFAARLEEAVAAGFPAGAPEPSRRRWSVPRLQPRLIPALGIAAAAMVAVVVALSVQGGGGPGSGDRAASSASSSGSTSSAGVASPKGVPVPAVPESASRSSAVPAPSALAAPGPSAAPAGGRRVERGADLTITTPVARLQDTADGVAAVVDRLGGYVASSDTSVSRHGGQATFDLRVPAPRLGAALAAISRLGHVRARSQLSVDITGAYNAARSRLHDAEAERTALLRALATAVTAQQIDSIHARLRIAAGRIVSAHRALTATRRRSDQARLGVTVRGVSRSRAVVPAGRPWTPRRAVHDALGILSALLGALIVALAAALPILALAVPGVLGARALRRRRRDHELHASSHTV